MRKRTIPLMPLHRAERILIERALRSTKGNKTKAANILGITSRTLYNKIRLYKKEGHAYFKNLIAKKVKKNSMLRRYPDK